MIHQNHGVHLTNRRCDIGACVERIVHDKCGKRTLQVFLEEDGNYTGFCFRCNEYVKDPYGAGGSPPTSSMRMRTPEEIQEQLAAINALETHELTDRRLTKRSLEYFGVKVSLSEADGITPTARHYPYRSGSELRAYKTKLPDKKMYTTGSFKGTDMFGWEQARRTGSKYTLFITEGEDDAVALFSVLKRRWNNQEENPSVVSLRSGVKSAASDISEKLDEIQRIWKRVVLVFDNDDPGRAAVKAVCKLLPSVEVAVLPLKDANDMVIAGREEELYKAVMFETTKKISSSSYRTSEIWHLADVEIEHGLSWPWDQATSVTRGRRRKEVYYFGAGVKMGKSVLVDQLIAHCALTQETPVFACKPEEPLGGTLRRLAGKAVKKVFWDPKISYSAEDFARGKELIGDRVILYDGYQGVSWETIKQEIRQAVVVAGVKDVFLDPLTCFTVGMSLTEANETLISIASEFASMANELDFTGYIFCHLNAPQAGVPHERGGKVLSTQFTGSRAMMRFCHQMWGLEGNKDPELDEVTRNTRTLVLLEDRNFGETARIPLFYDKLTGCLEEIEQPELQFGE